MSSFLSSQAIGLTRTSTTRHVFCCSRLLQPTKGRSEFQMDVYDSTGRKLGQVNDYGTASDNDGYKVGDVGEDGTVIDHYGRKVGEVSEDGTITDNHEEKLGKVSEDGTVTDSN